MLVLVCCFLLVMALFGALGLDIASTVLARERWQDAADIAAQAGALTGETHVKVRVDRTRWYEVCNQFSCWCKEDYMPPAYIEDREDRVWAGWERRAGCMPGCPGVSCSSPVLLDRWVEYRGGKAEQAALAAAQANAPEAQADVRVYGDRRSAFYPSVVVRVSGAVKSWFPGLTEILSYRTGKCGQAATIIRKVRGGGWEDPPADACAAVK